MSRVFKDQEEFVRQTGAWGLSNSTNRKEWI